MLVKKERADGGDDIGKNGGRHVRHVAFLKNQSKQVIKAYISSVAEYRVPYANQKKTDFNLMFQPQLFP
jgi:hypothetical protein